MNLSRLSKPTIRLFAIVCMLSVWFPAHPAASQTTPPSSQKQIQPSIEIAPGTILPVKLAHAMSSRTARPGQSISARVMQDVPLPHNSKIPEGARLSGSILSVSPAANSGSGSISFCFDRLVVRRQSIPIAASLRAVAGFVEVQAAETPEEGLGFGTPYVWATRRQIGGDQVYGVGGPVTDKWNRPVGTAVYEGVLVHVRAHPGTKCRGPMDEADRLQALWVFSSDACGVYGMEGVTIAHAGRSEPTGEITLATANGDLLVRGAAAMLLRVLR